MAVVPVGAARTRQVWGEAARRACVGPSLDVGEPSGAQGSPNPPLAGRNGDCGAPRQAPHKATAPGPRARVQGSRQILAVLGPGATVEPQALDAHFAWGEGGGGARAGGLWDSGCRKGQQKGPGVRSEGQSGVDAAWAEGPRGRDQKRWTWSMSLEGLTARRDLSRLPGPQTPPLPQAQHPGPGPQVGRGPVSAGPPGSPAGLATRALLLGSSEPAGGER